MKHVSVLVLVINLTSSLGAMQDGSLISILNKPATASMAAPLGKPNNSITQQIPANSGEPAPTAPKKTLAELRELLKMLSQLIDKQELEGDLEGRAKTVEHIRAIGKEIKRIQRENSTEVPLIGPNDKIINNSNNTPAPQTPLSENQERKLLIDSAAPAVPKVNVSAGQKAAQQKVDLPSEPVSKQTATPFPSSQTPPALGPVPMSSSVSAGLGKNSPLIKPGASKPPSIQIAGDGHASGALKSKQEKAPSAAPVRPQAKMPVAKDPSRSSPAPFLKSGSLMNSPQNTGPEYDVKAKIGKIEAALSSLLKENIPAAGKGTHAGAPLAAAPRADVANLGGLKKPAAAVSSFSMNRKAVIASIGLIGVLGWMGTKVLRRVLSRDVSDDKKASDIQNDSSQSRAVTQINKISLLKDLLKVSKNKMN